MAFVLVFCTTNALNLPAFTLGRQPDCGLTEHMHSDDCFAWKLVCPLEEREAHIHDETCWKSVLICPQEEREGHAHGAACYDAVLTCPLEECEGHVHGADCYAGDGALSCPLEEQEGHVHGPDCYARHLICPLEEREGHVHDGACWDRVLSCTLDKPEGEVLGADRCDTVLTCPLEECEGHVHGAACYDIRLTCPLEEREGHFHGADCYAGDGALSCPLEEQEGHIHGPDCSDTHLICPLEEREGHIHGPDCYTQVPNGPLEAPGGHIHDETCWERVLVCRLEAHTHTAACYAPEPEEDFQELCAASERFFVKLQYQEKRAGLAGAALVVREYSADSEEYLRALDAVLESKLAVGETPDLESFGFAALDIRLRDADGADMEPSVPVRLTITMRKLPEDVTARDMRESLEVLHLVEEQDSLRVRETGGADVAADRDGSKVRDDSVSAGITVDSLSPFTITWRISNRNTATVQLHYCDTDGTEITDIVPGSIQNTRPDNGEILLTDPEYAIPIEGYRFQNVRYNGIPVDRLYLVSENRQNVAYFYHADGTNEAERVVLGTNATLHLYYYYETNAAPSSQNVTLLLRYEDESAELDQTAHSVEASEAGTYVDLTDASYLKSFTGHSFLSLSCGETQDFDAVEVKLVNSGGTWVPVCSFLNHGVAQGEPSPFPADEPLEFVYRYGTDSEPSGPDRSVTLRLHYKNADGELLVQDFQAEATAAGNRLFLKAAPYLETFADHQFQTVTCYDYRDFDTIELLIDGGAVGCAFLKNGIYLSNGFYTGYEIENGVLDLDMVYESVNDLVRLRLYHVYHHDGLTSVLGDDTTLELPVDGADGALDLDPYILSDLGNKRFVGFSCTLADGSQAYGFDSIKALRDLQYGKIFELYSDGNYAGRSSIVGDVVIACHYVDPDDSTGDWIGGGTRPGGIKPLPEPDLGELPEAQASKTLTSNDDGTYTITLSMVVPQISAQSGNRANIVVIFDSSNSMHEPVEGNTWVRDDQHGTYTEYQGEYYQLISIGSNIRKVFSFIDGEGRTRTLGSDQPNNGVYCGPKYLPTKTRMDVAQSATTYLGSELLQLNSADDPDRIEIAFVEFASDIMQVHQPTTDLDTFSGWVNSCTTYVEQMQNASDLRGGTNWDAALRIASGRPYDGHPEAVTFSDDDQVYIIFITDGNPTARTTPDGLTGGNPDDSSGQYDDGARIGSSSLLYDVIPGVYGTGNSDTKGYNFNRAEEQAARIIDEDGSILFNVGIFGDADKMQLLSNNGYFEGNDEASLQEAFDDIVGQAFARMGYTNLHILDGITSMTSSTLIHGDPKDFTYRVTDGDGNDVTDLMLKPEQRNAQYILSPGDPYEDGYVSWSLGAEDLLIPGGTYSVSFLVWPSQAAYDLVADLNNGMRSFAALSPVEQSQVLGSGPDGDQAPFLLRSNTRQSVTYSTGKEVRDTMGNDTITYGLPQSAPLETPDPMPLTDSQVSVQKVWNVSLDPTELSDFLAANPDFRVELDLMKEDQVYVEDIQIEPVDAYVWPDSAHPEGYHISAGLMVSEDCAAASGLAVTDPTGDPYYPATVFQETTYYMLESGCDYRFREDPFDIHFELENRVFHPMVVDGVLMDLGFDGDGAILEMLPFENTLSATNGLRGSINVVKHIVAPDGLVIDDDRDSVFTVHCAITLDGQPLTGLEYRYYYKDGTRSEKQPVPDSSGFDLPLKVGETLRFVNVPTGCAYEISELADDDPRYRFVSITGSSMTKDAGGNEIPADNSGFSLSADGTTLYGMSAVNTSQQAEIRNSVRSTSVRIVKTDPSGASTLPGAQFGLFTELNPDQTGKVRAQDANGAEIESLETGPDGELTFRNLTPGTYYLVEERPPDGYSGLPGPITLQLGGGALRYQMPGGARGQGTAAQVGGETVFTIQVKNDRGNVLPEAGGPGTGLFRYSGLALISAAVLCFWRRRRPLRGEAGAKPQVGAAP